MGTLDRIKRQIEAEIGGQCTVREIGGQYVVLVIEDRLWYDYPAKELSICIGNTPEDLLPENVEFKSTGRIGLKGLIWVKQYITENLLSHILIACPADDKRFKSFKSGLGKIGFKVVPGVDWLVRFPSKEVETDCIEAERVFKEWLHSPA